MVSRKTKPTEDQGSRAAATREQILRAAAEALSDGDAAFSMSDVARRAGLTRQAVYLHFRDRGELLVAAVDELNRSMGLAARLRRVDDAPSGEGALEAIVETLVTLGAASLEAMKAVRRLLEDDAEARAAWARRGPGRRAAIRRAVDRLADEGLLRPELRPIDAAALVAAIVSVDAIEELTKTRRWSVDRAAVALLRAARAAVLVG